MGDIAERWVALTQAHRSDVPAEGGPLAGITLAVHTWGDRPTVPETIPMPDGGHYQLAGRRYVWSPKP